MMSDVITQNRFEMGRNITLVIDLVVDLVID